jgi:peptide/nickel transport system ATP-binding protein
MQPIPTESRTTAAAESTLVDPRRDEPSQAGGPPPLLSVRNLTTHFDLDEGTLVALQDVSFDVYPGRTVGLVGESGCGKSVTARSILRLLDEPGRIVNGEILLRQQSRPGSSDGQEVVDLARLDPNGRRMRAIRGAEIALIFQEPMASFSPVHTVGDQLIEAIRIHHDVSKEGAARLGMELLEQVGVPSPRRCMDAYSYELSGGLRQRTMIAMALSCKPRLLIADEPTTALDVTTQAQILELLLDLQRQFGMAILLITHSLGVIGKMADDVVVMYLGNVVETGPVGTIFHSPAHPYTGALLQSIPSLHARPKERLVSIEGSVPHPYNRPRGCPFNPRCPSVMIGTCDEYPPRLLPLDATHQVSCFLYHEPLQS